MKKIFILMAIMLLAFTGCKDEDDIFHIAKNPTEINSMDKNSLSAAIIIKSELIKAAGGSAVISYTKKEIYIKGEYQGEAYTYMINKGSLDRYNLYFSYKQKINVEIVKGVSDSELSRSLDKTNFGS